MVTFRKSLAFRVLALSVILLTLPLLADFFLLIQEKYKVGLLDIPSNNVEKHLVEASKRRELSFSELLSKRRGMISLVEYYLKLDDDFPSTPTAEMNQTLRQIAKAGEFLDVYLIKITPDGFLSPVGSGAQHWLATVEVEYPYYHEIYKYFVDMSMKDEYFYFVYDASHIDYHFLYGKVIFSKNTKKPEGILLFVDRISKNLNQLLKPDSKEASVNFALVRDNLILASSDASLQFQAIGPTPKELDELVKNLNMTTPKDIRILSKKEKESFFEFEWEGQKKLAFVMPISDTPFFLMAYTAKNTFVFKAFLDFMDEYIVYISILVIGGIITFFLTRRMARPLQRLSSVMESIQKGDTDVRYEYDSLGFELNTLGMTFNQMVDAVLEKKYLAEEERLKKEIYAKELRVGRQVQRSLFPLVIPSNPHVDIAAKYAPAKEVGGDFFDVFTREKHESELVLVVADASGKGAQACFYSLGVRSSLRAFSGGFDDVSMVAKNANKLFCRDTAETGMFVTVVIAFYNEVTRVLRYFSCGHNPPLLRRKDGKVQKFSQLGMAMGFIDEMEGESTTLQLEVGDVVVFYSDGVTEQNNTKYELFSEKHLMEILHEHGDKSAADLADLILEKVREFAGDAQQHDDITLLIMKVT